MAAQTETPRNGLTPRRTHVHYPAEQLRKHGGVTASSPAGRNRIAAPGVGAYDIGEKDAKLTRPVNARTVFSKTERFKENDLPGINGGTTEKVGPGAYSAGDVLSLGKYMIGPMRSQPKWTLRRKIPFELAKTSC
mmetsp:Transcript_10872/g.17958  ORF Transcript_10872/g.17958 Transcript_10872/m.17958 type:complete len:135 (-) Transcript_10872:179-583(-)|eukprot:CAMPEP_0169114270 /NCGR_PEP_ID=MMETSP1015-20121227/28653_1 /TAXON_ID=342587 /ORGANISM="Karlodinium micrum, Strain CCMP2283" /LENGTH=134 /DNA_ID=CAMNT_0009176511 /DNA_START=49 /DNA_END=453 /DNA_ORIENTATION=-